MTTDNKDKPEDYTLTPKNPDHFTWLPGDIEVIEEGPEESQANKSPIVNPNPNPRQVKYIK